MITDVFAGVLELADETDSKSVVSDGVWVRVPPPAPLYTVCAAVVFLVNGTGAVFAGVVQW